MYFGLQAVVYAGVPVHIVSARLGHASAKMTLDVYGHVLQHQQQDAVETYESYLEAEAAKS
jgi:integrase